jgi:aryl-alcohol dehydrogenase-like predicted oxidoreductase
MSDDRIPQRTLGSDGPAVGAVGLGCMGMTWAYNPEDRDEAESIATIHRALELGVTFLDTADMYGPFTNEELVGKALADRRDDAVLATKAGLVVESTDPIQMRRDGSPEHIRAAIDASLRRLRTDRVDLYQLHRVDENVPLEETWGAMAETVAAGKAGAIGLSEVSVEELDRAHAIHPVASVQSELSLWTRDPLDGVLAWCADHGAAFIPFSPLGRGFLTGRLDSSASFGSGDFRSGLPRFADEARAKNEALVDTVRTVAARLQAQPSQVALAWVLAQGEHVVPIPGTRRRKWLEENAAAANVTLSAEDLAELDALPAPEGARY